jgi:hypothetical protein
MPFTELPWNTTMMFLCYVYVAIVILVSGRFENLAESKLVRLKALSLAFAGGRRALDVKEPVKDVACNIAETLHLSVDGWSLFGFGGKVRVF